MTLSRQDFEILQRFEFEVPPVGIKFSARPPAGLERTADKLAFCEMIQRAQQGKSFFAGAQDHTCEAGLYVLGQADAPEPFINGSFGAGLQIYESPRTAARLYHHIPRIARGVVRYAAVAPLAGLSFDPDVLLVLADAHQTEILLRAYSYRTGNMWTSKYTPAIGCAWISVYPYLSGELNYAVTGLGHGMKRRNLFPPGRQFIAIPFDLLPTMLQTLRVMPWEPPAYKADGLKFVRNLLDELGLD